LDERTWRLLPDLVELQRCNTIRDRLRLLFFRHSELENRIRKDEKESWNLKLAVVTIINTKTKKTQVRRMSE
jgi:hypothetical protein